MTEESNKEEPWPRADGFIIAERYEPQEGAT